MGGCTSLRPGNSRTPVTMAEGKEVFCTGLTLSKASCNTARSVVGATTTEAESEKVMSPIWVVAGASRTNSLAMARAASRRLGLRSPASMDLEASRAITTAALLVGRGGAATGRALAKSNRDSASR